MIPKVLIVAGSDSGGGAGIQADLKTVSALGVFGMTAVTAVTAQNTTGVIGIVEIDPAFVARQIEACVSDLGCDAVKTGMLPSAAVIEAVVEALGKCQNAPLVVDPVMIAKGGTALVRPESLEALRRLLLPLATLVTPNLDEAASLIGRDVRTIEDAREAARRVADLGPRNVLVKGGHLEGPAVDVFFDGRHLHELAAERIATANTHGTGCILASAIAAGLASGRSLPESIQRAKQFVTAAIRGGLAIGRGHGPANPMASPGDEGD